MTVANRIQLGQGTWEAVTIMGITDPVNIGNINHITQEADVSAETQADIIACIATLTTNGFAPIDLGSITPPTQPTPPTPPTADEITRDAEVKTAFNTVMDAEIARLDALALIEYDLIKTTAEAYLRSFDIKHLRQRAN